MKVMTVRSNFLRTVRRIYTCLSGLVYADR